MNPFHGKAIPYAWMIPVEEQLRSSIKDAVGLEDIRDFRLLMCLTLGLDRDSDEVRIPWQVVAASYGATEPAIWSRNAHRELGESTDKILKRLLYDRLSWLGNSFVLLEPHWYQHRKTRIVNGLGDLIPIALVDRLETSLKVTIAEMSDPVLLDFHRRKGTPKVKHAILKDRKSVVNRFEPLIPLQGHLLQHLNGANTRTFSIGADRFSAARDWIVSNQKGRKQVSSLGKLRSLEVCSVPLYRPSHTGESVRIHPAFTSLASVKRELRPILAPDWIELDLVSAHLTFMAMEWDTPNLQKLIESGENIWESFWKRSAAHGVTESLSECKPGYKAAIYSIAYGGGRDRAEIELNKESGVGYYTMLSFIESFFSHHIVKEMLKASREVIKRVRAEGGVEDVFGRWISVTDHKSARSALSVVAQSRELSTLEPVLLEAIRVKSKQKRPDFVITLWQHDGFSIKVADKLKAKQVVSRLQKLVKEGLPEWCPKALEIQYAPEWYRRVS